MQFSQGAAIWIVLLCAAMWGFWWYPVALFEGIGLSGPWIGLAMSGSALPVAIAWAATRRGALSPRAVAGCILVGVAVTLYAMAASYTDFLRAVLLFYLAPAWSTLIEIFFLGRRWAWGAVAAILSSLIGVVLITRAEISFEGLGAIGDWMALGSGLAWSIGIALVFASRRAEVSRVLLMTALGGVVAALVIAAIDGSLAAGLPEIDTERALWPFAFAAVYVGVILAGTMWGAFYLPPAVMSYLLSVEIIGGVISSTLILGETFGLLEIGGASFIIGAVLIEVVLTKRTQKTAG